MMSVTSITDFRIIYWNIFQSLVLAFTFGLPLYRKNFLSQAAGGSGFHITLLIGYLLLFILMPLKNISIALRRFMISHGSIEVIEWFGARKSVYTLTEKSSFIVKPGKAFFRFRHLPAESKYHTYKVLVIKTAEGKTLKIDSRYYENFDQLHIAARKVAAD